MTFPRVNTTIKCAYETYNKYPFFQNKTIVELFNCSPATAAKIARMTREKMIEKDIKIYTSNPHAVDKDTLFELAGLDIVSITVSYNKLLKANLI